MVSLVKLETAVETLHLRPRENENVIYPLLLRLLFPQLFLFSQLALVLPVNLMETRKKCSFS